MGSQQERKKKKKERKKEKDRKKSKDRKERDRSRSRNRDHERSRNRDRSVDSSDSQSVKPKKKTRKSQSKQPALPTPHKFMYPMADPRSGYAYAPPPYYLPMMGELPIAPPPPIAAPSQSLSKAPKAKQPNIFKLLPAIPQSLASFCTTTFSSDLLGPQYFEQLISKQWKNLDRHTKALGIKRVSKLVSEGIAIHQRLMKEPRPALMVPQQKPVVPPSDYDLLSSLFQGTPLAELSKKIPIGCTFTPEDFAWPVEPQPN